MFFKWKISLCKASNDHFAMMEIITLFGSERIVGSNLTVQFGLIECNLLESTLSK